MAMAGFILGFALVCARAPLTSSNSPSDSLILDIEMAPKRCAGLDRSNAERGQVAAPTGRAREKSVPGWMAAVWAKPTRREGTAAWRAARREGARERSGRPSLRAPAGRKKSARGLHPRGPFSARACPLSDARAPLPTAVSTTFRSTSTPPRATAPPARAGRT